MEKGTTKKKKMLSPKLNYKNNNFPRCTVHRLCSLNKEQRATIARIPIIIIYNFKVHFDNA